MYWKVILASDLSKLKIVNLPSGGLIIILFLLIAIFRCCLLGYMIGRGIVYPTTYFLSIDALVRSLLLLLGDSLY